MFDTISVQVCGCGGCQHRRGRILLGFAVPTDRSLAPVKSHSLRRNIYEEPDMIFDIETEQATTIRVAGFKDRRGKPAPIDGSPRWATDNSDLLTIEPSEDGLSCKVTTGPIALAAGVPLPRVQVTADADLTEGEELLVGTVEFNVKASPAIDVELAVDPASDL